MLQQLRHRLHHRASVREEQVQATTQVVLPWIAVDRESKPVLRTASITKPPDLTSLALRGKRIALVIPELALRFRGHELQKVRLVDIAEQIPWFHKVIAGVHIAVVLERRTISARGSVDAQ